MKSRLTLVAIFVACTFVSIDAASGATKKVAPKSPKLEKDIHDRIVTQRNVLAEPADIGNDADGDAAFGFWQSMKYWDEDGPDGDLAKQTVEAYVRYWTEPEIERVRILKTVMVEVLVTDDQFVAAVSKYTTKMNKLADCVRNTPASQMVKCGYFYEDVQVAGLVGVAERWWPEVRKKKLQRYAYYD